MKNLKTFLCGAILSVSLSSLHSQSPTRLQVVTAPTITGPAAVVLSTHGQCEASTDGVQFTFIKADQILTEGAIIRTGEKGRVDVYFKKTGLALRLQKEGELKLTKMEQSSTNGTAAPQTQVDLTRGCIFTLAPAPIAGRFEVKNSNGLRVAPGKSGHQYMITAGSMATECKSIDLANPTLPAEVAKAKFKYLEGKRFAQSAEGPVADLVEFDELHALAESWSGSDVASVAK